MLASIICAAPKPTPATHGRLLTPAVKDKSAAAAGRALTRKEVAAKSDAEYADRVLADIPTKITSTGYSLFQKKEGLSIKDFDGGRASLSQEYSKRWKALGEAEQDMYRNQVRDLKAKYNAQLILFKKRLTPKKEEVLLAHGIKLPGVKRLTAGRPSTNPWVIFCNQYRKDHPPPEGASATEKRDHHRALLKRASPAFHAQQAQEGQANAEEENFR